MCVLVGKEKTEGKGKKVRRKLLFCVFFVEKKSAKSIGTQTFAGKRGFASVP